MPARKIHDLSPGQNDPFIALNIASISQSLFENELFANKKGTLHVQEMMINSVQKSAPILGISEEFYRKD